MKVMKFGGTSVGKPERMRQIAQLITAGEEPVMVVLSALSGTTNALVEISNRLAAADKDGATEKIAALENHYHHFVQDLLQEPSLHARGMDMLNEHFEFLRITQKISLSDALNKDILAQGELMSTKLFSLFLEQAKIEHALLPALDFMRLDQNEEPDLTLIQEKLTAVLANHPTKNIFVTQGYICRNAKGEVDNLKRGGSDYTASLIAAAVKNLKTFGYPSVNKDNIFTDRIYQAFFISMLNENKGQGAQVDAAIASLLSKLGPH